MNAAHERMIMEITEAFHSAMSACLEDPDSGHAEDSENHAWMLALSFGWDWEVDEHWNADKATAIERLSSGLSRALQRCRPPMDLTDATNQARNLIDSDTVGETDADAIRTLIDAADTATTVGEISETARQVIEKIDAIWTAQRQHGFITGSLTQIRLNELLNSVALDHLRGMCEPTSEAKAGDERSWDILEANEEAQS